ncbi:MAG: polyprenyl synthetase family protein [Elusimicrobiales bacterium]
MNSNEFLLAVRDDIKSEFEKVDKRFFDFRIPFFANPIGKGVRSLYCYYLSRLTGLDLKKAIKVASAAEIVHLASLIHDDCIDNADLRRKGPTLNSMFGVSKAILVGDMIVSFAFNRAKSLSQEVCFSLVDCVKLMSEGALFEQNVRFSIVSESDYEDIAFRKTSAIFRWISITVAYLSKFNNFSSFDRISRNFGLSFQIIDDVIDIEGEPTLAGKNTMQDLSNGKMTYPVIIGMRNNDFKKMVDDYIKSRDLKMLMDIRSFLTENGFIELSRQKAKKLVEDIKDDVVKIGSLERSSEFYNYLYSVAQRRF